MTNDPLGVKLVTQLTNSLPRSIERISSYTKERQNSVFHNYVQIVIIVDAGYTVLGYIDENLALNKPASQVNTYSNAVASRAVDGQDTGSCTTDANIHPWLSVDLEAAYDVAHVTVTNDVNVNFGNYRHTCSAH